MAENEQQGSKTGNFLQEELQEEYLKSLDELEVGQLVEGTVVAVTSEQVFIDVGYKSEGKINLNEFEDDVPSEGDTVQVVLINKEGRNGEVVVSKRKADEKVVWKELKAAFQDERPVEGKVSRVVKGGFEISLGGGNRGFNPISKMDLFRVEDPDKYVGLKSHFYIERLYSDNRVNIILSRRRWLEEEVDKKRNEFFANTSEGDVVEGTVKSFTSFGSFVDLGGFDGLLHINDMSWGHVARPKDHVKKGEVLQLKVTRLDEENKKINLSLKDMTENPWETFTDRFQLHDVIKGKVTKLTDFGAFIELENGIEGLAHISELSWTKRIKHPKEVLSIGEDVEAKILGFDLDARKVSLGIKQVLPNPWDEIESTYPVGTKLKRVVKKITATGAFVELEEGIDGFLHVDDLSWTKKYKNPGAVLKEGEEVDVMVIESSAENHNIRLGIKQLEDDPWTDLKGKYSEGSIIEGEVTNVTDFGVFVRVSGGIEGLIPKVHLGNPREINLDEEITKYKAGQQLQAAIIELNPGRQKLSLSIREMTRAQERQEIEKYISDSGSDEESATLADFMKQDDE
ncbi:30S ribosomal protein S1 [Salinispira pacifica]|uniref:30S ribosomal protein S1 n=1 Tax=Salinispira pacifica TaxID=1307761 RepID=V5WH88_9SPIO|nr:30S ribosomal protein S1 [Salinispira pacifica]AHC15163.1 SSU ribosomal protein S1p [Salinispira pacifica]